MNALKPMLALLLLSAATTTAVAVDDAGMRRCRALADRDARLLCYDGLPLTAEAAAVPATPPAPAVPATASTPSPLAVAGPAAAMAAPAAVAAPTTDASSFGLPRSPAAAPEELSTTLPGTFEGWGPRTRFKLANGQVWQVNDDSSGSYWLQNPRVTVRRALFGGFVMDIDGVNRVLRVRRVE